MDIANTASTQLPMAQADGCACCAAPDSSTTSTTVQEDTMNSQTLAVAGMTCGHCASAVSTELQSLPGVTDVTVDLVAGGTSTVRVASQTPLAQADIAAALDEAGDYQLVNS
ncbi:heavy-metal-associated domain-containing protein [Ornithinimicrobium sufpigmenti]|uniref:heavy-metal-associated domain-containing protein n=1 Tax=Ornithinimicrobium sufpigmenti TaxID=2508882 RepID=UPI001EDEDFC2|nr:MULTISPECIES: heavy metal-associated domain-containing protein [unclassified Ornithinimicrobium]